MDALLRRRAMIAAGGGSPTPPGPVVSVPYIRGGADGSYIDTGITPDNTTKVIVWARNFNSGGGTLFGSQDDNSTCFWISASGGTAANHGNIYIAYGTWGSPYLHATDQFKNFGGYHKYELYQGAIKVDDETVVSTSASFSGNTSSIFLFGRNNAGTVSSATLPVDICACKIYKNDVLVRDYTAVNSPSLGLYDAVSDTVFTNAGSGGFTYGAFDENAYTPLEYITCSGAQYFDTGLKGGYAVPWDLVFTPTNTTKVSTYPLGAQKTSTSERCAVGLGNTSYANGRLYFYYQSTNNTVKTTNTNNYFTNKKIVYIKNNNVATAFVNNAQEGTVTGTSGAFETSYNMFLGALNSAGSATGGLIGNIFYCGMGSDRNYVPAKVDGVAGMYDTYNDVFKPSISGTDFIAGPEL